VDSLEEVQPVADKVLSPDFFSSQLAGNRKVLGGIMSNSFTLTADKNLNQYAMQNFLDNILRGGLPITLGEKRKSVFHVYSRKHGDMERDYNQFQIAPTPYSQGDGNYRDVNQNRRCDAFFNPDTGMTNIVTFLNLLQLDGFNPLGVKGLSYVYKGDEAAFMALTGAKTDEDAEKFLGKPFTPGELVGWFRQKGHPATIDEKEMLKKVIDSSESLRNAEHLEGYWSDHWIYNLDLIQNYLSIYPEKAKELFWEKSEFTFYDDTHRVLPREDKHVLWDGHPLQMGSTARDNEKESLIASRKSEKNIMRKDSGRERYTGRTC